MLSEDLFEERVASLQMELKSYGKEIVDYISTLYAGNKPDSIDLKNDPINMLKVLRNDVNDILKVAQSQNEYNIKYNTEIKECASLSSILTQVALISTKITEGELHVQNFELSKACASVKEIDATMKNLPALNTEIGSGKVCLILRRESRVLKSRLTSKLRRLLSECIQIEHGKVIVNKQLKGMLRSEDYILQNPIDLTEVWNCIVELGKVDETLDEIYLNLWNHLLKLLWKEKKIQTPNMNTSGQKSELIFDSITAEKMKSAMESNPTVDAINLSNGKTYAVWLSTRKEQL